MTIPEIKRTLIGKPFPTSREVHERLDKVRGLAIFASDPISSNAYATEAIMSVLIVLGSGALAMTLPLAMAVAVLVLLVVLATSKRFSIIRKAAAPTWSPRTIWANTLRCWPARPCWWITC
jgi:hypothetical protein